MAHELGHNLGMKHDFIGDCREGQPKTIARDSKGVTCTDNGGMMDYYQVVNKWTTCSVENFTEHYNAVYNDKKEFCMRPGNNLVNSFALTT